MNREFQIEKYIENVSKYDKVVLIISDSVSKLPITATTVDSRLIKRFPWRETRCEIFLEMFKHFRESRPVGIHARIIVYVRTRRRYYKNFVAGFHVKYPRRLEHPVCICTNRHSIRAFIRA